VPNTGFHPAVHGFHFANSFTDRTVTIPGYGEVATHGRGGGMAVAALDYHLAGLPVPTHRAEDFPDRLVPEDGTRLADYLYKRLVDSFAVASAGKFVTWTLAADHPTWSYPGVARWTLVEELPKLRRSLDDGVPVVLGLVRSRWVEDLGANHQVVAYGYDHDDASGTTSVLVYDPDCPDREVVLSVGPDHPGVDSTATADPYRGFFVQDHVDERPGYRDLAVCKGIWVSSWTPRPGGPFVAQYTVRNYGDYRAHLTELALSVRGPAGEDLGHLLGADGDATPLAPGQERAIFKASQAFGALPGSHAVVAGYRTSEGRWVALPAGDPGTTSRLSVTVVPPARQQRARVIFTHVTVEDARGVGGRLALGLDVNGRTARWPEVGSVEVEDGKTFDVDVRVEVVLEGTSVLAVAVTGMGEDGEPGGTVRERWPSTVEWGAGVHAYRSRLPQGEPAGAAGPREKEGCFTINVLVEVAPLDE
jgi:hypothetical protein